MSVFRAEPGYVFLQGVCLNKENDMTKTLAHSDVHAETVAVAVARRMRQEIVFGTIRNTSDCCNVWPSVSLNKVRSLC